VKRWRGGSPVVSKDSVQSFGAPEVVLILERGGGGYRTGIASVVHRVAVESAAAARHCRALLDRSREVFWNAIRRTDPVEKCKAAAVDVGRLMRRCAK